MRRSSFLPSVRRRDDDGRLLGTPRRHAMAAALAAGSVLMSVFTLTPARAAAVEGPAATAAPSACSLTPLPPSPALVTLHQRIAAASSSSVRLLALGSSTTYGMDLSDLADRWPDRLMAGLAARGVPAATTSVAPLSAAALGHSPGALMVDGAVPGATAETMLAEYLPGLVAARATGNAPQVVLQMMGANDYWAQLPPAVFGAGLEATIDAINTQGTAPIEVLVASYRDPATTDPRIPWSAYEDQMRAVVAADPAHRLFIDLTPWFDAAQVPGADPDGFLDSGGVHPSVAGQQAIADLILRALGYGC